VKNKLKLALVALLLFSACPSWAVGGKGNLNGNEPDYLDNTFFPILIKAHICKEANKDCIGGDYIFCNSDETLSCNVYGISDEKVIKELFMSMLNSGLKVSNFNFYRSKHHEGSIFESPLLKFNDNTRGK
jgi:hypothetical protein